MWKNSTKNSQVNGSLRENVSIFFIAPPCFSEQKKCIQPIGLLKTCHPDGALNRIKHTLPCVKFLNAQQSSNCQVQEHEGHKLSNKTLRSHITRNYTVFNTLTLARPITVSIVDNALAFSSCIITQSQPLLALPSCIKPCNPF